MRLAWRITAAYTLLILAVTAALGLYLPTTLRAAQLEQLRANLASEARMVAEAGRADVVAGDGVADDELLDAERLCDRAGCERVDDGRRHAELAERLL
jgi:hypothetical protein